MPTASTTLSPDGTPPFPFLTLLVSGGHNMLVLSSGLGRHQILGSTLDDSIGEAFDKTARLLEIHAVPGESRGQSRWLGGLGWSIGVKEGCRMG